MNWDGWGSLAAAAACAAVLELDGVHIGQWMLSRPLVVGPLLGAWTGRPWEGVVLGALFELFSQDAQPLGDHLPLNAGVGASASVLLCSAPLAVPAPAAFPAGLGLAFLFRFWEAHRRSRRCALNALEENALRSGRGGRLGGRAAWEAGVHAAACAVFLFAGAVALKAPLLLAWEIGPDAAQGALLRAFELAPWIGLSGLARALLK